MKMINPVLVTTCGCHLWLGATDSSGYGAVMVSGSRKGRTVKSTHRLAWENAFGPIPNDRQVLHKCDIPSCINPEHLFLGTHKDNMQDAKAKGRIKQVSKFKDGHPYYPPRKNS